MGSTGVDSPSHRVSPKSGGGVVGLKCGPL